MKSGHRRFCITLALIGILAVTLHARQDPPLQFEVASVRLTSATAGIFGGRGTPGTSGGSSGPILCRGSDAGDLTPVPLGTCLAVSATLRTVIARAYGVGLDGKTILGGPNWIDSDAYRIDAKAAKPDETTRTQLLLMLRSLLADRFKLRLHSETRSVSGYALVVGKNGPKLKQALDSEVPRIANTQTGTFVVQNTNMATFSRSLTFTLGQPVVDETGLSGSYSFSLSWAPEATTGAGLQPANQATDPAGASIFTSLQEQLGLRLEGRKNVPVDVLVIDSVERPNEN